MGYEREIFEKVEGHLYDLRLKSKDELEKRKKFFYIRYPRAKEIEKELAVLSSGIAKAVLKGKNVKEALKDLKIQSKELKNELSLILANAKLQKNYLELWSRCEICKDEGFINGKICSCMKELLKKEAYKKLSDMSPLLGCNFRNFSLDYYPNSYEKNSPREIMRKVFQYCLDYAKKFNKQSKNLIFMGNTGLGKTHISMAIATDVINKGYSVIYTSAHNMISEMEKEKFKNFPGENIGSREHFLSCDLLIIDDLGMEFTNQFSNSALYDIINSRLIMKKPVIISTNLSFKEFEKKYSSQITSRVFGCYEIITFEGKDIRSKIQK